MRRKLKALGEFKSQKQIARLTDITHGSVQFVVSRREKYSWFTTDGLEWLFDLENDPQELVNLAAAARGR